MSGTQYRQPIRITLVNDYQIVVEGLRTMLSPYVDRVRVVELEAGGIPTDSTDIAMFDTFAARRSVSDRIRAMAADGDIGRVVLYTWDAPLQFVDDLDDVDAIVLKSVTGGALVDCIERIHAGENVGLDQVATPPSPSLSEREQEVLARLALGDSNRQIADELYLSVDTVKTHVKKVFGKLGVTNRTQAALVARSVGLGPPE